MESSFPQKVQELFTEVMGTCGVTEVRQSKQLADGGEQQPGFVMLVLS